MVLVCLYLSYFVFQRSEGGLFVDLNTFLAFGKDYVTWNYEKTGNPVYLHLKQPETRPSKKPRLMTIGVAGGLYNNDESHSIVLLPDYVTLPYPSLNMPDKVRRAVESILTAEGAKEEKIISAGTANKKKTSKYSKNLQQIGEGRKVPSSGWKCSKCAMKDNLWMNLTDGTILCGRKRFDGTGGNNHAIEHYEATKYPLAVKLRTLTADLESADVFSYPEDDSVIDPLLAQHLTYFGLDFSVMQKTEITTAELKLKQKNLCETLYIKESKQDVEPIFGPGYTGLVNLGCSCYMAAILQVVLSTQSFCSRYYKNQSLKTAFQKAPADPTVDLNMQLTKLAHGLLSGKYSVPVLEKQDGISPRMFKAVIASDHADFSSNEQQDAMLFFLHFINEVERAHDGRPDDPVRSFKFGVEERRIMCSSGEVSFTRKRDHVLSLIIPLHQANIEDFADEYISGSKQVSNGTVQRVSLAACLAKFLEPEEIQYNSTTAMKTVGLTSFPDYLTLHLQRYVMKNGVQKKIDVPVDVPDIIDITHMRSTGLQPAAADSELPDREGRYRLIGIVSHIGPSIDCGHYVAHVWREDKWVIFNDT